jgi:hypothetical protein
MKVTFAPDGGFAAMPGLNRSFTIETAPSCDRVVDRELEQLVRAARDEHDREDDEQHIPSGQQGGDRQMFRITVVDADDQYVLEYLEPVSAPAAAALVERLRALARAAP